MCRYSWDLTVLGQMTVFTINGCRVRLLVSWSISSHPYTYGRTRGAGLLGAEVGVLMVSMWFAMRSCPWRQRARVLYLCTCVTVGF